MKKKLLVMSAVMLGSLVLSACSFDSIFNIIIGGDSSDSISETSGDSEGSESTSEGGSSSESGGGSSSGSSSSSESTSEGGSSSSSSGEETLKKTKIKETYNEYIDQNAYPLSSCPTTGNAKVLIIPIWFTNSKNYITDSTKKANVKADIEKTYLGSTSETGWHSVKTYYKEESSNKLNLSGTVADWYECGQSATYYTDSSSTAELVVEATDNYFTNNPSDSRKNYDSDGDGWLDAVILIYAAPDYAANAGSNDNLWAYCFWVQNWDAKSTSNPAANVFFWASYDFMYDSSTATARAGTSYSNGDCSHTTVDAHTFIHEFGHVMGLEDYYDYGSNKYTPAGAFSMQDYNVGGHDPYSVMAYGWADPYIPTKSMTLTIGAFQHTKELILLTPSWNSHDSAFDEYMLLELYTPTGLNELDSKYVYDGGYPQGPSTVGIRLWHVDSRLGYYEYKSNDWYLCSSSEITNTVTKSNVELAMSNTYPTADEGYLSPFYSEDSKFGDYNLLQLIRKNTSATYKPTSELSSSDLFTQGSSFSMNTYKNQFKNSGKLNSNINLGWTFTVKSITGSGASAQATIELVKQ